MTIGSQFLSKVLAEAKAEKKVEGFKFDRNIELMKKAMRTIDSENDLADKIAEIAAMVGIPGSYLNRAENRESIIDTAVDLKTKTSKVRVFLALHNALISFYGAPSISEAKAKKEPEPSDADLEGDLFQQLVEEVLVDLGVPVAMVIGSAKASIKMALQRVIARLRSDDSVRMAFRNYARVANIKLDDDVIGSKKSKKVMEADDAQEDSISDPKSAAMSILKYLGVDIADQKLVRIVNDSVFSQSVRKACRDGKVKRAMASFLRIVQQ